MKCLTAPIGAWLTWPWTKGIIVVKIEGTQQMDRLRDWKHVTGFEKQNVKRDFYCLLEDCPFFA